MTRPVSLQTLRLLGARREGGATLIIGLILLALLTLIVINSFKLASSNLRATGNLQFRDEALAAAGNAIEQAIAATTNWASAPPALTFQVDIDRDGTDDYTVALAAPLCVRAQKAFAVAQSDIDLQPSIVGGTSWDTEWDFDATVTSTATGAAVRVHQGMRVLLSAQDKTASCP
jgi:Tfp pilus assembly protein PilX